MAPETTKAAAADAREALAAREKAGIAVSEEGEGEGEGARLRKEQLKAISAARYYFSRDKGKETSCVKIRAFFSPSTVHTGILISICYFPLSIADDMCFGEPKWADTGKKLCRHSPLFSHVLVPSSSCRADMFLCWVLFTIVHMFFFCKTTVM